jgi:prophage antirepressor-like protein
MAEQLAPLQQFEYLPGMNLRVLQRAGEPWFVAADVGKALGLGNMHSSLTALDRTEKGLHSMETPSGRQRVSCISESGLYLLVLKSRKEEAKAFQKWVTGEVMPSIRKTGEYVGALTDSQGRGIPLGRPPSDSPL